MNSICDKCHGETEPGEGNRVMWQVAFLGREDLPNQVTCDLRTTK